MMKKLLMSGLLITGLIVLNPAFVQACPQKGKSECTKCAEKSKKCKISKLKKKVKMLWVHKDMLGINDDQMKKIKNIKHKAIKEMIQLKADKDIIKVDLKAEKWAESLNVGAINKLIDAKYDTKKKSAKTFVKAISDIQNVLSAEQRAQWREMMIQAKLSKSSCSSCAAKGNICPITGQAYGGKGSYKGSMR